MTSVNIFSAEMEYDEDDPAGYKSAVSNVGKRAGGDELAVKVFDIPPGQSLCPYHYEYVEEWLLVLEGDVVVRVPDGETPLQKGGLMCFAPGPDGAHKVSNAQQQTARVLMFSSGREPAVAVYPDSDKIGVWTGNPDDKLMLKRADGQVGYWEGEG
ncbi:MAG TPA: cupin domain-containing protein [Solirubrobacteraceae bacterium]|nr:cupin domain-containing protein [Solirubrobacteraceae bacterium]